MRQRREDGKSAVDIMEEAVHLLRAAPSALAPYFIGSLPFILGLLYFWTDMSSGAFAWRHCSHAAWGLVLLFIWMKTWQSVYMRWLLARIRGEGAPAFRMGDALRAAAIQTAIQPWSMICLPLAFIILIPFPQALAFFQNAALFGSGDERDMRTVIQKSWRQAALWPGQNMLLIWLASPFLLIVAALFLFVCIPAFASLSPGASVSLLLGVAALLVVPLCPLGMITALNTGMALLLIPWLLKTLLDIDTLFSVSGAYVLDDTFFAVVCGVSYLCLDPLLKAAYCLRCFYGESLQTGEDLMVKLRSPRRLGVVASIVLAIFLALGPVKNASARPATAAVTDRESRITARQLDSAIERVIDYPEYAWRMPREKPSDGGGRHGALYEFTESMVKIMSGGWAYIKKGLAWVFDFIGDILSRISPSLPGLKKPGGGWTSFSRAFIIVPLVCIMAVLTYFAWRAWKDRRPLTQAGAVKIVPVPDITREDVDASALPEDGWLNLARELMGKGDLRLALRALYLGTLAFLAGQDLITVARYKSDREYEVELRRRSHARPRLVAMFTENRELFERAWYGLHQVTPEIMQQFSENQERIRADAQR